MDHVFISYVRENSEIVDRLARQLRSHGITVWLDREQIAPGQRWKDAIGEAIGRGAYFIACFSSEATAKQATYQNEELILAIEQLRLRSHRTTWFIPVLLNPCEVPDRSIGAGETLNSLQHVNLYSDWVEGIRRIINVIRPESVLGGEIRPPTRSVSQGNHCSGAGDLFALDFGTSFSTVGILDDSGKPLFLPAPNGRMLIPSTLSFDESMRYVVGWEALEAAPLRPERTFFGLKRLLGSSQKVSLGAHEYSIEPLVALIIGSLKKNAEEYLQRDLKRALVAVPANFGIAQANSLARACEMAGVEVERLIGEPNAAGMLLYECVSLDRAEGNVLVLDLGGGTFDVSVLEFGHGVFEAKAVVGTNRLGGMDYDEALYQFAGSYLGRELGSGDAFEKDLSPPDRVRLRSEATRAKIALSSRDTTSIILPNVEVPGLGLKDVEVPLSRADARKLFKPLDDLAESCVQRALRIADLRPIDLSSVMIAGQGMKIFTLEELVERWFLTVPLIRRFQEGAVARGLCHYVGVLTGRTKDLLLLDSNYTGIAVRCMRAIDRRRGELNLELASSNAGNQKRFDLLPLGQTVPLYNTFRASAGENGVKSLEIIELGADPDQTEAMIGIVEITPLAKGDEIDLVIEADANRTLVLWVKDPAPKKVHGIQLNNPFKKPMTSGPSLGSMGMESEGYEILPVRRIDPI